ncbi:MAG TPA: hypothetical protein PLM52_08555, partial [Tabrizicola sp.]|nr:hypothetical protein [Tabrizicola sp.]
ASGAGKGGMTSKAERKRRARAGHMGSIGKQAEPTLAIAPWDQGASGPANQDGLVVEERGDVDLTTGQRINPNRIFGKRRMPIFMRMLRQGRITASHAAAAERLYSAWAGHPTRDPLGALGNRVDGGSCDDANVTRLDKQREFFTLKAMIPAKCWPVVEHVVIEDKPIRGMTGGSNPEIFAAYLARLAMGLDAVR